MMTDSGIDPDPSLIRRCLIAAAAAVPALASNDARASRISGGISNHNFVVSHPECSAKVLVRFYGAGEPLCDRTSEEALVQLLSVHGFGPKVLTVFAGGRVEQYWDLRRPLVPTESLQCEPLDFAGMVARRLAELHNLGLSVQGRPTCEEQLSRWFATLDDSGPIKRVALRAEIDNVATLRPLAKSTIDKAIQRVLVKRTLCHLDLFAANILYDERLEDVQFIDYEYVP